MQHRRVKAARSLELGRLISRETKPQRKYKKEKKKKHSWNSGTFVEVQQSQSEQRKVPSSRNKHPNAPRRCSDGRASGDACRKSAGPQMNSAGGRDFSTSQTHTKHTHTLHTPNNFASVCVCVCVQLSLSSLTAITFLEQGC